MYDTQFSQTPEDLPSITAKSIAEAVKNGAPLARVIYTTVGFYLGRGLSIIIDIINPERVILGGIYMRAQNLLEAPMRGQIGGFSSLCVAYNALGISGAAYA